MDKKHLLQQLLEADGLKALVVEGSTKIRDYSTYITLRKFDIECTITAEWTFKFGDKERYFNDSKGNEVIRATLIVTVSSTPRVGLSAQRLGRTMAKAAKAAKAPEVFELNRGYFMAWVDGILLHFERGKGIVLDGSEFAKRCEAAEAAMDRGETIYLTDGSGKRITKMSDAGDGYLEEEL